MKHVVITGANGQLGRALQLLAPAGLQVTSLTRQELDIGDRDQVLDRVRTLAPDCIINAAAYTGVDAAEADAATAKRINADAPAWLAEAAREAGAAIWHVSTDFVFDGQSVRPYRPDDETNPLGVYGRSKLEGELRLRETHPDGAHVVRTAWVYAADGKNFVRSMLRLLRERDELGVVDDQIGTPTCAQGLAEAIWRLSSGDHLAQTWHWTDAGVASWYDFADAIRELAAERWPQHDWGQVRPIRTSDYPTPAARPAIAVLDKQSTWEVVGRAPHWRARLAARFGASADGSGWL